MAETDHRPLRDALASYATGIAVVTTRAENGRAVGMTVNSFTAVSLSPPLVSWSAQQGVGPFAAFEAASHYAVHVLHCGQEALARHFAQDVEDKFESLVTRPGIADLPLLPDYAALFQCVVEHRYPGGDHLILVGRVLDYEARTVEPLVFHGGRFRHLTATV